jgi:hypothetical protein
MKGGNMMIRTIPEKVRDNIKNLCPDNLEALGLSTDDVFAIDSFVLERLDEDTVASLESLVDDLVDECKSDKSTLILKNDTDKTAHIAFAPDFPDRERPTWSSKRISEPLPTQESQIPSNGLETAFTALIQPLKKESVDYIILRNLLKKLDKDVRLATLREIEKELSDGTKN